MFILFLRQRETEHEWGRGRERGRHRIRSRLQALSHQPRARRGARTHRPRDRDLSWSWTLNQLSHPGAPKFFFNVYLFLRQRDRAWTGEGQREREAQNPKQAPAPSCQPRAWRGARTHRPRDRDLSRSRTLNRLSHPGAPCAHILIGLFYFVFTLGFGEVFIYSRYFFVRYVICKYFFPNV